MEIITTYAGKRKYIPIAWGWVKDREIIIDHCPYCGKQHVHGGAGIKGDGLGKTQSLCSTPAPYRVRIMPARGKK